jgi:hypothetical protein
VVLSETIIWHKYPEEKPTKSRQYLAQIEIFEKGNLSINGYVSVYGYKDDFKGWLWAFDNDSFVDSNMAQWLRVVAWADMPKGWVEE